jgi:hypothetical protein
MPGSKSDIYEIDILKATTGQATTILSTTPLTPFLALFTAAPSDSTAGTEVSGGSYARIACSGATKWNVPAAGSVTNNAVLTFPTATADWTTVVAFGLMTTVTGGSLMMWGTLTTNKPVGSGDTASFAVGQLTLTED